MIRAYFYVKKESNSDVKGGKLYLRLSCKNAKASTICLSIFIQYPKIQWDKKAQELTPKFIGYTTGNILLKKIKDYVDYFSYGGYGEDLKPICLVIKHIVNKDFVDEGFIETDIINHQFYVRGVDRYRKKHPDQHEVVYQSPNDMLVSISKWNVEKLEYEFIIKKLSSFDLNRVVDIYLRLKYKSKRTELSLFTNVPVDNWDTRVNRFLDTQFGVSQDNFYLSSIQDYISLSFTYHHTFKKEIDIKLVKVKIAQGWEKLLQEVQNMYFELNNY